MSFPDALRAILRRHPEGLTPQQVRETIKREYPELYGTEVQQRNVERGHYTSLDHALLAQIYVFSRSAGDIATDRSQKPLIMSLLSVESPDDGLDEDGIEDENLQKLEEGLGTLYVLGTDMFTRDGEEMVKIGITTGSIETRIKQLFTTGVPSRFRIIKTIETKNYAELEHAIHKLLDPFRLNRSREFFTERCLPFVDKIVELHGDIQSSS